MLGPWEQVPERWLQDLLQLLPTGAKIRVLPCEREGSSLQ